MPLSSLGTLPPLAPLSPTGRPDASAPVAGGSGFAQVLQGVIAQNTQATAAADGAVTALATGQAQDLHSVSLAVAQADLSFRLILELRNRLTEAYQEVQRMQV
jgi:flagellar hook-basal body complex protein FliE